MRISYARDKSLQAAHQPPAHSHFSRAVRDATNGAAPPAGGANASGWQPKEFGGGPSSKKSDDPFGGWAPKAFGEEGGDEEGEGIEVGSCLRAHTHTHTHTHSLAHALPGLLQIKEDLAAKKTQLAKQADGSSEDKSPGEKKAAKEAKAGPAATEAAMRQQGSGAAAGRNAEGREGASMDQPWGGVRKAKMERERT